jgi:hypothetical protein
MPLLSRKRVILAKTEVSYGVDPTPSGAANAILVSDLSITPIQAQSVSRNLVRPYLGSSQELVASKNVQVTCTVEVAGSGAAGTAPQYGPLLKACGMSETISASTSVTYAPVSSSFSSITIVYNVDGVLHKVTGARGTVSFDFNVNNYPVMNFTFTGIYNAVTDTALPTPTYTSVVPLPVSTTNTSNFSILGYSGCLQQVTFDVANSIVDQELVGCKSILLTDRAPTGTVIVEAPTIATKDFFAAALGSSTGLLTLQHGSVAGNIVTLNVPQCDVQPPTYQDVNGIHFLNIPFAAIPTTAGNDEFSLVVT